jgi:hypothetical protein
MEGWRKTVINYNNIHCSGVGKIDYSNGTYLDGDFKDDKANGHGCMVYSTGDKYDGSWFAGQKHG